MFADLFAEYSLMICIMFASVMFGGTVSLSLSVGRMFGIMFEEYLPVFYN